jgi:hypothetical protein
MIHEERSVLGRRHASSTCMTGGSGCLGTRSTFLTTMVRCVRITKFAMLTFPALLPVRANCCQEKTVSCERVSKDRIDYQAFACVSGERCDPSCSSDLPVTPHLDIEGPLTYLHLGSRTSSEVSPRRTCWGDQIELHRSSRGCASRTGGGIRADL